MKTGQKVAAAATLIMVVAVGGELLYLHRRNAEDAKPVAKTESKIDPDVMALYGLKHEHPMSLKDEMDLKGRTLWVSAGGQMDFYPFNGKVDYAHSQGTLLGAEAIVVKDAVEQVAPKSAAFRIPQGDKQVLLVFTKPNDPGATGKTFAVPVGFVQGGDFTLQTDQIFFYKDPRQIFDYWGPQIWKAIDEHRAIVGMNEFQVQMALGQVSVPHGDNAGDRTVDFDDQGKPKTVTFENGKATKVVEDKP